MSNDPSVFCFSESENIETLLARNRAWAQRLSTDRPGLFPALAESQHPQILWIGCSDSRVPETSLLDLLPGEVFVHRNIANVLPNGDLSSLSVIQYALEHLGVRHIIVCGHHGCGGVLAALGDKKLGLIDNWIKNIRDVRAKHKAELDAIDNPQKQCSRLVELNVIAQVHNLKRMANVQKAIERGVQVHGLVYGVGTGCAEILEIPRDPDAELYDIKATPE
ncbi:carbonic anhydrase [Terfezia boudieri ATCC MYA-4762]|uniref:Carbonic anhydrase n=1 Tax=Terfezia boudieri ATCC MYA-4762 TaxID=1051890 RepID=A0A3N4L9V1_9PEZI|nr:carbonic anhydrase [Terfezia boudieri ATCC MYA-4762]